MNNLRFYFEHSLIGYSLRRAKQKWFTSIPAQVNHYGVSLQVDCLSEGMQKMILYGNYEFPEIKVLPSLISSSDQVLEIGAAIGFVGLYCRKISKVKDLVSV